MGKIPKKKHRGVKDPYKQQEMRLNLLKNKVDRKPPSTEIQELPRKLQAIANFNHQGHVKNISDSAKKKKRRNRNESLIDGTKFVNKECEERGMSRPNKMIPVMKQLPREDYDTFLKRVDRMTKTVVKESKFENKYQVDVARGFQGQVTSITPREQLELDLMRNPDDPRDTTRSQKKRLAKKEREQRKKMKRRKKDDDDNEFSCFQDKVEFGEVVSEPPTLDTKKLTRKVNGGLPKSKTFLFMDKMKSKSNAEGKKVENVSLGHQRMLEEERLRVMAAYSKVKAARTHAVSPASL